MGWMTLDDMDLAGKRVLVRVDINVPVQDGAVTDDTRIRRLAPTIRDILQAGGKPILLAHFGRPKGKRVAEMSLRPLVPALEAAFGVPVAFCADCRGPAAQAAVAAMGDGDRSPAGKHPLPARRGEERSGPRRRVRRPRRHLFATTPSRPRTGRTPRPRAWRGFCPPARAG